MMKKFFLAAIIAAVIPAVAKAQFCIEGGYAHSGLIEKESSVSTTVAMDGVYLLGDYTFSILRHFSITPGLQYEFVTENMEHLAGVESRWNEHYLDIPVRFNYGYDVGRVVSLGAYAAPTFSFGLASKLKSGNTSLDFYEYFKQINEGEVKYARFDLLLGLGVYCEILDHLRVRLGYDYGIVNRTSDLENNTTHRSRFQLGVGYIF